MPPGHGNLYNNLESPCTLQLISEKRTHRNFCCVLLFFRQNRKDCFRANPRDLPALSFVRETSSVTRSLGGKYPLHFIQSRFRNSAIRRSHRFSLACRNSTLKLNLIPVRCMGKITLFSLFRLQGMLKMK
jgi:hypothetical protein